MLIVYADSSAGSGSGAMIPVAYALDSITPTTNAAGQLTITRLLGFGQISGAIDVIGGTTFTLNANNEFVIVPMPYDSRITAVAGHYSTVADWPAPTNMSLYIAVAIAPKDSNVFTINESSKALAPDYERGVLYQTRTARTGIADHLDIKVKQGERIAILAGYQNTGTSLGQSLPFNFAGSIAIQRD